MLGRVFFVISFLAIVKPSFAQEGAQSRGLFELGVIGGMLLPSRVPGVDEIYPMIGPHIALNLDFGTFELQPIYAERDDNRVEGAVNHMLYIPLLYRNIFRVGSQDFFWTIGGHAHYYEATFNSGRHVTGLTGGANFGGGYYFLQSSIGWRIDLRYFVNPGQVFILALVGDVDL